MYEAFYGFSDKPFQLTPDPAFYFGSRGHKRALAYLEYGLYQGEGFILITGEVGAGKTTLLRSLLAQLDQHRLVAAYLASTQLDADDIVRSVCAAFGLLDGTLNKASLLSTLERFLEDLAGQRRRALLIVDEAQNLSPETVEELRLLSNFQIRGDSLLQIFLVGQPEFREIMRGRQMQQLRQRVIASYHLGPLDREEAQAYIEHRLQHVGWKGDPSFEKQTFDEIFQFTGGIPRRINTLCNRILLAGYLTEAHVIKPEDARMVIEEVKAEMGGNTDYAQGAQPTAHREKELQSIDQEILVNDPHVGSLAAQTETGPDQPNENPLGLSMVERIARLEKVLGILLRLVRHTGSGQPAVKREHELTR